MRSKVKVPRRSLRYTTHHLMVMHPHTKYHWPISKDKKYYGQDKKILFKKQLFDLHVKGQGPTKVITVCDTPPYGTCTHIPNIIDLSRKKQLFDLEVKGQGPTKVITVRDTLPYGHTPTYQILLTYLKTKIGYGPDKKILFKKPLFDLEVKVPGKGHYDTRHTTNYGHAPIPNIIDLSQKKQLFDPKVKGQGPIKVIMVCNIPPYGHAPTYQISLTYLERNNYLTLRSKVKVQTNVIMVRDTPLMVMHPHTKYHWPISKDKKVMVRTSFAEKQKKKIRLKQYISPFVGRGDIIKIHI